MGRLRRARARGATTRFWRIKDGVLLLPHPGGHEWTEVPIAHLDDEAEFRGHLARLRDKWWVDEAAIDELLAIRAGRGT